MKLPRLGVRWRLFVTIVGAVAVALAVAVVAFSVLLGQRLSSSATSLAKAQAEAELSSLSVRGSRLVAREGTGRPAVGQTWIFGGAACSRPERVARGRSGGSLARGRPRALARHSRETRLYAVPVIQNGVRYGTSSPPYPSTRTGNRTHGAHRVLGSPWSCSPPLPHSWWMLGRALLPVSRMTEDAANWSEYELDRRFGLGEPTTSSPAWRARSIASSTASRRASGTSNASPPSSPRAAYSLSRISGEAELVLRRERTADEYRGALAAIQRSRSK